MKRGGKSIGRGAGSWAFVFVTAWLLLDVDGATAAAPSLAVKAQRIYLGDGRTIENGTILIQDGRIKALGPKVRVPPGTPVVQIDGATVTPGLIDANARIEPAEMIPYGHQSSEPAAPPDERVVENVSWKEEVAEEGEQHEESPEGIGPTQMHYGSARGHLAGDDRHEHDDGETLDYHLHTCGDPLHVCDCDRHVGDDEPTPPLVSGVHSTAVLNEQSSEVVPHIRVLDALDPRASDFQRLVRGGVTTVYASPDASAVIGARGAILHTAGPMADRVIVAAAAVKAVIGADPSSLGSTNRPPSRYSSMTMYARRPNSRMGLVWVFRKAFYDAARRRDGLPVYGADTASPQAHAVLLDVLEGHTPLRIQARLQQDISAAIRLTEEFGLSFTLEEATEAYRCLEEIKASGAAVIFGPIYEQPGGIRLRGREGRNSRYYTFGALLAAGIPTALSAQEFREEDGLARQAMYAQRFGVEFDAALLAVTQTPAKLLGIDDRLGTLDEGKQADLIVWSGHPFAATSSPVVVLIGGQVVVDRR